MPNSYSTHTGIVQGVAAAGKSLNGNIKHAITLTDGLRFVSAANSHAGLDASALRAGAAVVLTLNGRGNVVAIEEAK